MSLRSCRARAFRAQNGLCFYCECRMWQCSPAEVGLSAGRALHFKCTAEHLVEKQNGGRDCPTNIVAACWFCSTRRHRLRPAPSPTAYKALVQRLVKAGAWRTRAPKRGSSK